MSHFCRKRKSQEESEQPTEEYNSNDWDDGRDFLESSQAKQQPRSRLRRGGAVQSTNQNLGRLKGKYIMNHYYSMHRETRS